MLESKVCFSMLVVLVLNTWFLKIKKSFVLAVITHTPCSSCVQFDLVVLKKTDFMWEKKQKETEMVIQRGLITGI